MIIENGSIITDNRQHHIVATVVFGEINHVDVGRAVIKENSVRFAVLARQNNV